MEAKYYIFLGATIVFIPVASWFGIRYRWAERMLVAGAFFSTCYLVDINLVSLEWYRGDTRGFEFGVTDWMIISLIIVMVRSPRWQSRRLSILPPNSAPIVLYLGIALLSVFVAYVPTYAAFGVFKLLRAIAVYWVGYNYLRSEEDLYFILMILAAMVGMEFLLVLKQRATGIYRAVGSTPHPNTLAIYINMMNVIFMSFLMNDRNTRLRRYIYLASLGAGTLIVLATFSRGGMTMMAAMDDFQQGVNDMHRRLTGPLAIAIFDKTATNPQCKIHRALALFDREAAEVHPEIYVEPINAIENGVMEGRFQLGIIPNHRPSSSLSYYKLFDEQMYLYCSSDHTLFKRQSSDLAIAEVRSSKYVGIGYHSPNMEVGRELGQHRDATAYDQEAVAHLVLSGAYLGYLPEHYAEAFVSRGRMRALLPEEFQYVCEFSAIVRHAPAPNRATQKLLDALVSAHQA